MAEFGWEDGAFLTAYDTTMQEYRLGVDEAIGLECEQVAAIARSLVRVDTGALRDSIKVSAGMDGEEAYFEVGTNGIDYAADQEYGTSDMPAQPYMRPAVAEVLGVVV